MGIELKLKAFIDFVPLKGYQVRVVWNDTEATSKFFPTEEQAVKNKVVVLEAVKQALIKANVPFVHNKH